MKLNPVKVLQDFSSFFPMLWAILRGRWKMNWNTFIWTVLCVIYLISPIDFLPDVLPILGITDDGAFILLVLTLIHKDLEAYRAAQKQPGTIRKELISPDEKQEKK